MEKQLAEEARQAAEQSVWGYADHLFFARALLGLGYHTPESRRPFWELAKTVPPRELAQVLAEKGTGDAEGA